MSYKRLFIAIVILILAVVPMPAMAQDALTVAATPTVSCGGVAFEYDVTGGVGPYTLTWSFGDGVTFEETEVSDFSQGMSHTYLESGEYEWSLTAADQEGMTGSASGFIAVDVLSVSLNSDPFPPLLDLSSGNTLVIFSALVAGTTGSYTFEWDLNGDGVPDAGTEAINSFTYTEAGKYPVTVTVTDECGSASDTLAVVVVDPEAEACHPRAKTIADAVNTLFPMQAYELYTCEDILDIFTGGLTGSQTGFGRLWHAYQLAERIGELTWEEIRDWHLDGTGWGLLVQLDRFADALEDVGIAELYERVRSGEISINQLRTAVRAVTRYGADFEEALERITNGANPGELGQLYRIAQELGVGLEVLDEHLANGVTLADLRHAAKSAERLGVEWDVMVSAIEAGHSWGEIGQAYRLADEDMTAEKILDMGVQEYRRSLREGKRSAREDERNQRTAEQIARKFGVDVIKVWEIFEGGMCSFEWNCVRKYFREN